jgi:hypothetical protein
VTDTLNPPAAKRRRPYDRPPRTANVILPAKFGQPAMVSITIGKASNTYAVRALPSDFGEAFEIQKLTAPGPDDLATYHVLFENEQDCRCECKGFLRWGRCKHVETIRELRAAGHL